MKRTHWSTWYPSTETDWRALPTEARETLAFEATGCTVAYPTWPAPADCVHGVCRLRRGEIRPIYLVNAALRYERESGWLRFVEDRARLARIYRVVRRECRRRKTYDIWEAWPVIVYGGVMS